MNMIVNYLPCNWLCLGVDVSAGRQIIKEAALGGSFSDWFFQRSKENHSVKSLENTDVDSGVFKF